MRATLFYTTLRLGLFVVVAGLLYAAGVRSYLWLAGSILVSGILSYFLLTPQRAAMSSALSKRVTEFRDRLNAGTRAEDD